MRRPQEEKFVADGFGVRRYPVMYNDFILVGPKSDTAGVNGIKGHRRRTEDDQGPKPRRSSRAATSPARMPPSLRSGRLAGIDLGEGATGTWYKEIGQGMGAALNTASASNAYVLADRGTWLSFKNRGDLVIAVEGDNRLFNQYGVMLVNPEKHKHVKKELGQAFIDWLVSAEGQKAIADYKIGGQQLFFPNANAPGA